MFKPALAVVSLAAGCVAFALLARLSAEARRAAPPVTRNVARAFHAAPPPSAQFRPRARLIELAPLVITATPRRKSRRPAPPAKHASTQAKAVRAYPCSPWRPLGPVYSVRAGEKPAQRYVRLLCFGEQAPRGAADAP